jgi:multidrug efflux pump subunit AcrB
MRNRIDGLAATAVQEDDERLDVLVRLRGDATENITDVWAFDLKPHATKRRIPLAQLAGIRPRFSAASIYRRDGERTLTVLAYPEFGLTAAQVAGRFRDSLASFADRAPEGYSVELGGENEQRTEAEGRLLGAAVYSVCVIILLLTGEFRSFRLTALILAVIPLSLAGTMLGLFITGWPLNFMALMGMMMLIGVVVNDAVILIDGYERRRRAGEAAQRVLIDGTVERTRHVVITTVTTIAGFLPLALSPSLLWPPLAIAVIGGLALSTLLTLVAVPAAYGLLMFKEPPTARSGAPAP